MTAPSERIANKNEERKTERETERERERERSTERQRRGIKTADIEQGLRIILLLPVLGVAWERHHGTDLYLGSYGWGLGSQRLQELRRSANRRFCVMMVLSFLFPLSTFFVRRGGDVKAHDSCALHAN